ncbi:TonB-dependent receptor [Pseudomaricurvus alkylphenolicus]|uniref:TonB-dependent receptor n=1 Tax=Pseudomaricurvus alkylphenolicus TaxID=1306991 RepID=UPI00141E5E75|nr:TonB-dependent receptor [Pseudomaricurvus alkylphenolicus]NIB40070.1 TonB-dependent receptor [Pseudomaricurvus alkylphenolicus]
MSKHTLRRTLLSTSISTAMVAAAGLAVPHLSHAETYALEEVVVTAQKREQSLMDVPISVNAVDGAKMNEAGITNLEGMTAYVPNLTMNQTGIGTIIAIRGISSGINQGFEQSVGQYVDGIYYGRAQLARAPFMDLERVEVLRGPQSILFGKNSIAGAISMLTAKPTDEFEGSISALYEPDHEETDVRLVLSGPLTDNLSGRLAILDRTIDGYYDNDTLDRPESDEEERVIRGSLKWDVNNDLTINLKVEDGSFDTKGRFLEIVNPVGASYAGVLSLLTGGQYVLDTDQDFNRQANGDTSVNDTENVTLNIDYAIGDHTLTLVTGYNAYEYREICDCDFTGASIFTVDTTEDFEQFSQEIRITSPGGETLDYIAGFFYQSSELDFTDAIIIPSDSLLVPGLAGTLGALGLEDPTVVANTSTNRAFEQDTDLWSIFAQVTWNISDAARLTLGARYTDEDKEASRLQVHIDQTGTPTPVGTMADDLNVFYGLFRIEPYAQIADDRNEGAFTPLVTFQYDVTPDAMLYATYTTGFKSGGFDVRSNAHPDSSVVNAMRAFAIDLQGVFEYEEEEAESIEFGGKFTLADGAAELNVALFRTEYTDLQTSQFDGTLGFNVTNAGEATSQGLELDGRWRVSEGLTLSGSAAYLDFEYDKFPNAQCYFGQEPNSTSNPGLCDVTGKRREFTPEYQASLSADYVRPLGDTLELRGTVDFVYSDSYLASPALDPNLEQDSFTKVNARISIGAADGQWDLALVGKNLTDEEVVSFGNIAPLATTFTGGAGAVYYGFYDRSSSVALQGTLRF